MKNLIFKLIFTLLLIAPTYSCYSAQKDINKIEDSLKKYKDNPFKWSRLNYAVEMKDFEAALNLIEYTLEDINHRDRFKPNIKNPANALERLLQNVMNENLNNPINTVYELSDLQTELIYKLLEKGIDIKGDYSFLIPACFLGLDDLIILFVEKGVDVNKPKFSTPLYYIIRRGNLDMSRYLLDKGASIDSLGLPLTGAIISLKTEMVDLLIERGADISTIDCLNVAFMSVKKEAEKLDSETYPALEMFHYLLQKGANPNFWILKQGTNPADFEKAYNESYLIRALNLPSETPTQHMYKERILNILLDYGAVAP
jgi:ankyrin repeat protein